jgi:ribosomal protein S24E
VEERPNPLLKRTEYRFEIVHAEAATPTRDQVRGELSKQLKVPKERLIVERMHARFGAPMTRGEALAYADPKSALAISREHILIRNGLKEKAVPAAPGAAPAAPAAPAPAEKSAEKPTEKAPEKHAEKASEKHPEKTPEKHSEKGSEKSAEKPSEKGSEKHSDKGAEKPSEKPAGKAEKASAKKE